MSAAIWRIISATAFPIRALSQAYSPWTRIRAVYSPQEDKGYPGADEVYHDHVSYADVIVARGVVDDASEYCIPKELGNERQDPRILNCVFLVRFAHQMTGHDVLDRSVAGNDAKQRHEYIGDGKCYEDRGASRAVVVSRVCAIKDIDRTYDPSCWNLVRRISRLASWG